MINAEIGRTENLVLNGHYRVSPLGLMTCLIHYHEDGLDDFSGYAYGGGLIYFLGTKRNKPNAGLLVEYDKADVLYTRGEAWEY
jgi:hypothetical protein